MSQGSSNPALPSRPVMASEQQETLTPVSHIFGLSEVSFYGRKGSSKAGLIQDVAIEAGRAVREIPTWMGLTAK